MEERPRQPQAARPGVPLIGLWLRRARRFGKRPASAMERHQGHYRDGRDVPGRRGDNASSGPANQDHARLRRRGALVGRSAASSVVRLPPPLTGSNKAGWRRSGLVLGAFLEAAPKRFDAGASCAKLRFNAAIKSMTGGAAAISL